jgi:hypothetical protein
VRPAGSRGVRARRRSVDPRRSSEADDLARELRWSAAGSAPGMLPERHRRYWIRSPVADSPYQVGAWASPARTPPGQVGSP